VISNQIIRVEWK